MEHGGARPGAGRKPKAELYAARIRAAEKRCADKLPDVVDAMLDDALGLWVEETDEEGERRVYQRRPNFKAAAYILDRIMGKVGAEPEPEPTPPAPPVHDLARLTPEELDALLQLISKASQTEGEGATVSAT